MRRSNRERKPSIRIIEADPPRSSQPRQARKRKAARAVPEAATFTETLSYLFDEQGLIRLLYAFWRTPDGTYELWNGRRAKACGDIKTAKSYFLESVEKGCIEAAGEYALLAMYDEDFDEAAKLVLSAAEHGDPLSIAVAGYFLTLGLGWEKDEAYAQRLQQIAWEGGCSLAMSLGKPDNKQAARMRLLADMGCEFAMNSYGIITTDLQWVTRSAQGGCIAASDTLLLLRHPLSQLALLSVRGGCTFADALREDDAAPVPACAPTPAPADD